jgi:hypothetical protein
MNKATRYLVGILALGFFLAGVIVFLRQYGIAFNVALAVGYACGRPANGHQHPGCGKLPRR